MSPTVPELPVPNKNKSKFSGIIGGAFKNPTKFSFKKMLVFALIIGAVGTYLLWRSFAAVPVLAKIEAEQMSQPSGASSTNDTTASSGKASILTQNNTSLNGPVSLPNTADSLTVIAKASKCRGAWPSMTVTLDGTSILGPVQVSSSSWRSFTITKSMPAGTPNLSIKYTAGRPDCNGQLYVDVTNFYGSAVVQTPAPTVAFSASATSVTAGSSSTLTWSSTNADSCTASGAWSGTRPTSGSATTGALTTSSTYTIACTGKGGIASANATVTVTAAPIVTTSSSIYWGSWIDGDPYSIGSGDAPWSATTAGGSWDLFESHATKKVSVLHYGQPAMWSAPFYPGTANLITNRGAIPYMDMSSGTAKLTDITNKVYDSSIITWATAVKTWGKPFFFRWNWEMNGTWFDWGAQAKANPAAYVAAWKHMHDVVASQGATNVTWVWCPNTEYSGSTPLASLYPGDSYVDWTCIDGYNWGTNPSKPDSWKTFSQVFSQTYNNISVIAPDKPIMIGETASSESGGSKSAWITDALTTQIPKNFPKIKAVNWFNWNILEGTGRIDWPIESSASSQSAFGAGIASPFYKSNTVGTLTPLTKVPVP